MSSFYIRTSPGGGTCYIPTRNETGGVGATGAAGPKGATGPAGAKGATGPAGARGATGPAGAKGATGPAGAKGATGPAGARGATGAAGARGATGAAGARGATGAAGARGATGANGSNGLNGATGSTGATGGFTFSGPTGAILYYDGTSVTGSALFTWEQPSEVAPVDSGGGGPVLFSEIAKPTAAYRLTGGPSGNNITFDDGTGVMTISSSSLAIRSSNTSTLLQSQLDIFGFDKVTLSGEQIAILAGSSVGITGEYLGSDGNGNVVWSTPPAGGATGETGAAGPTGPLGSKVLYGDTGPPAENIGSEYDTYIDTTSGDFYSKVGPRIPTWSETSSGVKQWVGVAQSEDGQILYAIVEEGSIWKSADGGSTWNVANDGPSFWSSILTDSTGTKVIASAEYADGFQSGIFYSSDSGETWTEVTGLTTLLWGVMSANSDFTQIAAATGGLASGEINGVWMGTYTTQWNWVQTYSRDLDGPVSISSSSDGGRIAASGSGYVLINGSSGATGQWVEQGVTAGTSTFNWNVISLSGDGTVAYTYGDGAGLFRGDISGNTWTWSGPTVAPVFSSIAVDNTGDNFITTFQDPGGIVSYSGGGAHPGSPYLETLGKPWTYVVRNSDGTNLAAAENNIWINRLSDPTWVFELNVKGQDGLDGDDGATGSGITGATGATGPTGPTGATATVAVGTVTTLEPGSTATVGNSGTSYASILNFGIPRGATGAGSTGPTGETGATATVAVGTVTTLEPGSTATVENSGTSYASILDFGIPRGATGAGTTGPTGATATVAVGTVTTLEPGSTATVENSGTPYASILDFGIPRGATGTFEFSGPTNSVLYYDGTGVTGSSNFTWDDSPFLEGQPPSYVLAGGPSGNNIGFDDGSGNMFVVVNATTGRIDISSNNDVINLNAGTTLQVYTGGSSGLGTEYLGSDGLGNVVWKSLPPTAQSGFANVLLVDQQYGDDSTGIVSGSPYLTVNAAVNAASSGHLVWVMPGFYNLTQGLTLADGVSIRGLSTQTTTIQMTGVTGNTTLLTLLGNNRVEDLTLRLESVEHHTLKGILLSGQSSVTSKLRTCVLTVDNRVATPTGTSEVYGIEAGGTGTLGPASFSFNSLKGSTINVYSNGAGKKRGILVSNSNVLSTRDLNVYVAAPTTPGSTGITGSTGSYVGVETNDTSGLTSGSIQMRATTIGTVKALAYNSYTSSDILQTVPSTIADPTYLASAGIQIGPGLDLVTKSAGGKPFSTYIYPTVVYYGLKGALNTGINAGIDGYLWPGTQAVENSGNRVFPDPGLPAAFYRIQQPAILSGLNVACTTGPGAVESTTIQVYYTPKSTGIMVPIPDFRETLTGAGATSLSYYNTTQDLAAGDRIHVGITYSGGGSSNTTHDLSIQLDMF